MAGVPSLACEPHSTIMPSSYSSSNFIDRFPTPVFNDDSEVENPPPLGHVPPIAVAPILPQWVCSTCEGGGGFSSSLSLSEIGVENLSRKMEEEEEEGTIAELGSQAKDGTPAKLGLQAKRFSSDLTSLLMIISCEWG